MQALNDNLDSREKIDFHELQKLYCAILLVCFLYFAPLILQNNYYFDDLTRSTGGSYCEQHTGRPLANFVMSLSNFDFSYHPKTFVIAAGPYYQIISILLLVLAITLFILKVHSRDNFNRLEQVLIAFSIFSAPNLLQNFSWKFDCWITIFSMSIAIIASLDFFKSRLLNILFPATLVTIFLSTYQASFNIFLACIFYIFFTQVLNKVQKPFKNFLYNFTKLIIGFSFYKLIIIRNIKDLNSYYGFFSQVYDFNSSFFKNVFLRLKELVTLFYMTYSEAYILLLFLILTILFFLVSIFKSETRQITNLIVFNFSFIGTFISIFGFLIFLKYTFTEPRIFIGLPMFYAFVTYVFIYSVKKLNSRFIVLIFLPLIFNIFIAYSYAAALNQQGIFTKQLTARLLDDLKDLDFNEEKTLLFDGTLDAHGSSNLISKISKNSISKNPLLKFVFRNYLGTAWYTLIVFHNQGYDLKIKDLELAKYPEHELLCKTKAYKFHDYNIHVNQNTYLVAIKDGLCQQYLKSPNALK